ncbi:hypothetical protein [Parerythrobacter aestuarii]|uniref:hypothetical protein n=1 Tax=Parerythrobacter aestuarii TaxID=3020909 RepID=UPI0024DE6380|nr:hypothetical protein [Parerythrobacter aestuarii]
MNYPVTFAALRRMLATSLFVAGLALVSPRAVATPPDSVNIEDTVIGASATHLFVLRSTADNLGSHFDYRGEVWLVSIAVADGSEEHWPVYGVSATTDFTDDGDRRVVTTDPMEGQVNPFAIMADRKATPMNNRRSAEDQALVAARISGDVVELGDYTMALAPSLDRMRASVAALASRVADPPRMATVPTAVVYGWKAFEPDLCGFEAVGWPLSPADGSPSWQAVRVTCEDPDVMDMTSLIQIAHEKPKAAGQ